MVVETDVSVGALTSLSTFSRDRPAPPFHVIETTIRTRTWPVSASKFPHLHSFPSIATLWCTYCANIAASILRQSHARTAPNSCKPFLGSCCKDHRLPRTPRCSPANFRCDNCYIILVSVRQLSGLFVLLSHSSGDRYWASVFSTNRTRQEHCCSRRLDQLDQLDRLSFTL